MGISVKKLNEQLSLLEDDKKEFEIDVKIAFEGTVTVKAEDEAEAKWKAEDCVTAILGKVETQSDDIVDYDIDTHGYCHTNLVEEEDYED